MNCERCGDQFDTDQTGKLCPPCETELGAARYGFDASTPVEINLESEGQALATILSALHVLDDASKFRVLDVVAALVGPEQRELLKSPSVRVPKNGFSNAEVVTNLRKLEELQGTEDEEAP